MGLFDIFHDAASLVWKTNPTFWQSVAAIHEADDRETLHSLGESTR